MKTVLDLLIILVLFGAGIFAIDYLKDGSGPARLDPFITDPACGGPPSNASQYGLDISSDPIFRAGTVPVFNDKYIGHGSIVKANNKFYFVTIEHVADITQGNCAYYYFPSSNFFALARFSYYSFGHGHNSNEDELAYFEITGNLYDRLAPAIASGSISPLVIKHYTPKIGEVVAIPDPRMGDYTLYVVDQINNGFLTLVTNGQKGLICGGRSGGPVLKIEDGFATNQLIAVISSINTGTMFNTTDGNRCGYISYAVRP